MIVKDVSSEMYLYFLDDGQAFVDIRIRGLAPINKLIPRQVLGKDMEITIKE